MQGNVTTTPVWFEQPGALHRVICDLVFAELATLRRRTPSPPLPWREELSLTHDLGADSLELLSVATRLSEMLHIHQSGIEDYLLVKHQIDDWTSVAFTSLQRFSSELTFLTSGSSGTPKPCTHHSA